MTRAELERTLRQIGMTEQEVATISNVFALANKKATPPANPPVHPKQDTLPLAGLAGPSPCFPETRPHILQHSTRPDPAGFGRYIVDSFLQLTREAASWMQRARPTAGWALTENAPDFNPEEFLATRISQVCSLLGMLSSEAQTAWRDECRANAELVEQRAQRGGA